jgi:hypothetical protein
VLWGRNRWLELLSSVGSRSAMKVELHVAVTLCSLLDNFVVLGMKCCDVKSADSEESNFRVKLNFTK